MKVEHSPQEFLIALYPEQSVVLIAALPGSFHHTLSDVHVE